MHQSPDEINKEIVSIEERMSDPEFWADKVSAQETVARHQELKDMLAGVGKYDSLDVIMSIYAGAGGDDAEDFVRMLVHMYAKYADHHGWQEFLIDGHPTSHGGYRSYTMRIAGKKAYGTLKKESGVHRLIRQSPFNSQAKRQTSFAMVEVIPDIPQKNFTSIDIPIEDLDIVFQKSGGPGGQNVNKRETAVRITHIPTGISVYAHTERTQERNRDIALSILKGKIIRLLEEQERDAIHDMAGLKDTSNEWGSQIRSYILHPYQMVKDHRTDVEVRDVKKVLEHGDIQEFIDMWKEGV